MVKYEHNVKSSLHVKLLMTSGKHNGKKQMKMAARKVDNLDILSTCVIAN